MARRRYWNLSVSTFKGVAFGAVHWYGQLWNADTEDGTVTHVRESIYLEYPMTAEHVAKFIELDGSYIPLVGNLCERFWTREEVLAAGLAEFEARAQEGDLLLVNGRGNPSEPLAIKGPDPERLVGKLRAIWKAYDALWIGNNPDATDPDERDRLIAKWDRLMEAV